MADARLLHKKGSCGERIIALDHLQFRVWVQYVLSADDYGVMRASASVLRADNPRLEREPFKRIVAAMLALEACGLVQIFEHQGAKFWWQTDWQDFQCIRYPRDTGNPSPSPERLTEATAKTQALFGLRAKPSRERLGAFTETSPLPAGAGARQTHTLTANTPGSGSSVEREPARHRRDAGLINGSALRAHGSHGWCSLPRDGLCVPAFLHDEFVGKLGRPSADADLRVWYRCVVDRYDGISVGDDTIHFWRNEFASWVGMVTSRPTSAQGKGSAVVQGVSRGLERYAARKAQEGR